MACNAPCLTCTSATACLSCVTGKYFVSGGCYDSCPSGISIPNSVTKSCDSCHSSCATCANTTTTCTSCVSPLLLYQNQCLSTCPTPLVSNNYTCAACDTNCLTCINDIFTCTSCDGLSSNKYLYNSKCINKCPTSYYENVGQGVCTLCSSVVGLNCNDCTSVSTCNKCNAGYVLYNRTCLNYVPSGYVNISGVA